MDIDARYLRVDTRCYRRYIPKTWWQVIETVTFFLFFTILHQWRSLFIVFCFGSGSTQVTDRQTIVDTFNNDKSIFACLLSTRAGGQGLNLTGADTVIIHDMDFNPQIDRQAEDRCHRSGQTKPVTIFRFELYIPTASWKKYT